MIKPEVMLVFEQCVVLPIINGLSFEEGKAIFRTLAWLFDNLGPATPMDDIFDAIKAENYYLAELKKIQNERTKKTS